MKEELREFVLRIIEAYEEAETRINEEWTGNQDDTEKEIDDLKRELDEFIDKIRE